MLFCPTCRQVKSAPLVNSTGHCDVSKHSVFTNVAYYVDWINEKMKLNTNGSYYSIEMDCEFSIVRLAIPG